MSDTPSLRDQMSSAIGKRLPSPSARRGLYPSIDALTSNAATEEQQIAWGRAASTAADGVRDVPVTAFDYEWRVTYTVSGRLEREGFGLDEKGARAALRRYSQNPEMTDLCLWRRPKPAKWEVV